ncbi:MAG: hypothetical protein IBX56_18565 [Methylomicrobium sp.]|nr:hypothetical protein [Methylomicrobium sp.]
MFASVEYQPIQFLRLLASAEYNSDRFSDALGVRIADEFVIAKEYAQNNLYK